MSMFRSLVARRTAAAVLVAVGLFAAACGDDASEERSSAAGPSDSGGEGTTTGVTDDSIKLGTFGDVSGAVASVGRPLKIGHEIVAAKVNESGGINGREIRLVHEDDQYDPAKTVSAVRKLVERDEVFMLFGNIGTPQCEAVLDYLEEQQVPVVQCGVATRDENVKWPFQIVPTNNTVGIAMAQYAIDELGVTTVGIAAQEGEVGQPFIDGVRSVVDASDLELVETVTYKATDTDLSSQTQRLRDANPELVFVAGNPRSSSLFYNEAAKLGWKPSKGWFSDIAQNDDVLLTLVEPGALEGAYIAGYIENLSSESDAMTEFLADVEKYAPGEEPSAFMLLGYAEAMVTVEALKRAGEDLTRERVLEVLENDMEGFDLGGLIVPLQWTPDSRVGVLGISVDQITDGGFERVVPYFEPER